MSSVALASIVFVCLVISTQLGMLVRTRVPAEHLSADSRDAVKLSIGLIATMAALVLGLLTASAKSSFDTERRARQGRQRHPADWTLASYGPETRRSGMSSAARSHRIAQTWPEDDPRHGTIDSSRRRPSKASTGYRALSPQGDAQQALRAKALQISGELLGARWLLLTQAGNSTPLTFLVVLVFWLSVLFASFGFLGPRNATVTAALFLCALSVAGSTFLILEMDQPLEGWLKISSAPLVYALSQLDH
jgi:hypothetical protein